MGRSNLQRALLRPEYRRRVAVGVVGLCVAGLMGGLLFVDTTWVPRTPASRKWVDTVLGTACQLVFLPSLVLLLMTFRSAAKAGGSLDLCPTCGYDLRASPRRCPECGTERGGSVDAGGGGAVRG